jgi:hypothetical protein
MARAQPRLLADIGQCQSLRTYPRGLKLCKQFLKKYPNHPEASAWNAYFTYMKDVSMGPTAIEMMKQAIRLDMSSAKIWRIAGLLYREMQDFPRAAHFSSKVSNVMRMMLWCLMIYVLYISLSVILSNI